MSMHREHQVRQGLLAVEALLKAQALWQNEAPDASAFASTQPFFLDTMQPLEWLQWVLIPRMHALLDAGAELPQNFAIAPYYEMSLTADVACREELLGHLNALDALFVVAGH
ncbi:YqcC family protein [Mixta intestinalis]|nr:YqcC family protein [Mixta intestinalis]